MAIRVALTFDAEHADRPNAGGTERLLDVLAAGGTRATFFLQGRWVESAPDTARAVMDAGHVVGSHGHYHCRMSQLTDDGIRDDVALAEAAICEIAGVDPRPWFRCPFGAGSDDPGVLAGITRLGYREVSWDVEGFDWRPSTRARGMARQMTQETIARGDGAVVLLHPWTRATERGLLPLIDGLREAGATFVQVDALA
jgi:peptidoglycan/xylan/chitin deacetylase (PgdA/CDA1 family)